MSLIVNEFGTPLAAFTAWLMVAAGVRMLCGRAVAWAYDAVHMLHPRGYRGEHAGFDWQAAEQEFEQGAPWRETGPADEHDIGDGAEYAAELRAIVEQIKAEDAGEVPPLPLSGDDDREAVIRVLQERTAEVDLFLFLAARQTRSEFDELVWLDPVAAALFEEERARLAAADRELMPV